MIADQLRHQYDEFIDLLNEENRRPSGSLILFVGYETQSGARPSIGTKQTM